MSTDAEWGDHLSSGTPATDAGQAAVTATDIAGSNYRSATDYSAGAVTHLDNAADTGTTE